MVRTVASIRLSGLQGPKAKPGSPALPVVDVKLLSRIRGGALRELSY